MKTYVVEIVQRTTVEVTDVKDAMEAQQAVRKMYEQGDACTDLGDPTFTAIDFFYVTE